MNTNENSRGNGNGNATGAQVYRPSLRFYHANAKGTGCAMRLELHPAHDRVDGSIFACLANQMTVGDRQGPNPTFPRFDWENAITVKLDFSDLSMILQVLRGECEDLQDGRGLFHRSTQANTRIALRHLVEAPGGYSLDVFRTALRGGDERRAHILISTSEATGLAEAIAGSMAVISFGIPMVIAHDTSAYEAEMKELRNAPAA